MTSMIGSLQRNDGNTLSARTDYLKINFTPSEKKVFTHKEKNVNNFFSANGVSYNQTEYFRVLSLNFDNPDLMALMSKLYLTDCNNAFKGGKL
ncbi:hypothetical protein Sulku_1327 [Sulfuricurvum kujiense DSM 16994]|uniref:Uncharacterized protein n=1 Tax=Sulfuricurvum kujiense (strain ATCC BAA-921 / DSM 16994 / JCM 11577 / YK-1) TaxID=709032 RepID=E4TY70_SULKY|nr:hypothetical protein [Sulfuricurvum kujiense]ADR33990.1 hypothetical protein Sulku_1327 [Sulfuricurvum kujiense DSM 16994]